MYPASRSTSRQLGRPSRAPLARRARRGFALIVTLGLMTLLLLLVLTLTTLVRINMITANSNLVATQARQNALLAAYIGVGQLQKFAGPDQRATANAYITAGGQYPLNNDNTNALSPLLDSIWGTQTTGSNNTQTINVPPIATGGTWYWTGVWGPGINPLALYTGQGLAYNGVMDAGAPAPVLLNWLVSGDEGTPLSSNFTKNGVVGAPPGLNGAVAFTPDTGDQSGGIVSQGTSQQYLWTSLTNDITILPKNPPSGSGIKGPQPAALLVGPNTAYTGQNTPYTILSAGSNPLQPNGSQIIGPRQHQVNVIVAPIIEIHDATPDYTDATKVGVTSGRYAFWVGDEGVKAKYTPVDPYVTQNTPTVISDPAGQLSRYRFWAPLRTALERMSGFNYTYGKFNGGTASTSNVTVTAKLKQLLDPSQIYFVDPNMQGTGPTNAPPGNAVDPEQTLAQNYFDFTTYSYGLLTDELRGGLRYDLTTAFQEATANGGQNTVFLDSTNGLHNRAILPGDVTTTAASIAATTEPNVVAGASGGTGSKLLAPIGPAGNGNITFHGPDAPPPPGAGLLSVGGLRWDAIENYYNIAANNTGSNPVPVQAGSTIKAGITPLITQFRLRFGQIADHNSEQYVSVEPEFVLANPYSFPITDAGGGMDLGFRINTSTIPPGYRTGWEWAGGLNSRNDVRIPSSTPSGESIALGYDTTQSIGFGLAQNASAFGVNFISTSGGSQSVTPGYYPFVKDPVDYPSGFPGGFNSVLDNVAFHIAKGANSTFAPGEAKVYSLQPNSGISVTVAAGYTAPEGIVSALIGSPLASGSSAIANSSIAAVAMAATQPGFNSSLNLPSPYYLVRDTGINTAAGKYKLLQPSNAQDPSTATPVISGLWPGHTYGYISTMDPGVAFTLELRSDIIEPHIPSSNSDTQQSGYTTSNPNYTVSSGVAGPGQNVLQSITNMDLTGAGLVAGNKNTQPSAQGYVPPFALGQGYRRQYLGTGKVGGEMPVFLSSYEHMLAFPGKLEGPGEGQTGGVGMVGFWVDAGVGLQSPQGWFDPSQFLAFSLYKDYNLRATNMALPPFASFNSPWAGQATTPTYSPSGLINNIQSYMTTPPYGRVFDEGPGLDDKTISGQEDVSFSQNSLGRSASTGVGFVSSNSDDVAWGYSNSAKGNGMQFVALYSLPQRGPNASETLNGVTVPDVPMLSLGQLTHADFTQDDIWCSVGYQPGNAFGNSYFTPFVSRGSVMQQHTNLSATKVLLTLPPNAKWLGSQSTQADSITSNITLPMGTDKHVNAYDISYLMNVALWDRYFFSTLVPAVSATPANSRMAFATGYSASAVQSAMINGGLNPNDPATNKPTFLAYLPARYLMIDGAFNVNSTSFEAWRSVLSALRGVAYNTNAGGTGPGGTVSYFPRTMASTALANESSLGTQVNAVLNPSNSPNYSNAGVQDPTSYAGFRQLTDDQIDLLAAKIVQQVHQRGPFLSLAQFVNRSLVYPYAGGSPSPHLIYSVSGPLQAAIDMNTGSGFPSFNSFIAGTKSNAPADTSPGLFIPWTNGTLSNSNSATNIYPDGGLYVGGIRPYNSQYDVNGPSANPNSVLTGIPGWLTQADLLQVLAPILAARSDTFTIRSYGEVLNPAINQANLQLAPNNANNPIVSDPSSVLSRAWCELVVQRMPDYIASDTKSLDDPSATTGYGAPNPSAKSGPLHPVNAYFGRRFRIVSIRWLSADDI